MEQAYCTAVFWRGGEKIDLNGLKPDAVSPCIGRTRSVSITTTRRHGVLCSVLIATTSQRPCTSRPRTSAGTQRSTMKVIILTST